MKIPTIAGWERKLELWGFLLAAIAQTAPLWAFPLFPSQDGPIHASIAEFVTRYAQVPIFRHYLAVNPYVEPNLTIYALLAGLVPGLASATAEKLVVALVIVLIPLAARHALEALDPAKGWLAWLALPLATGFFLHMGFYNYCYGTAFYLIGLAWWLRHREAWRPGSLIMMGILGIMTVLSHITAFAVLAGTILALTWHLSACDLDEDWPAWRRAARRIGQRAILPMLAFFPAWGLCLSFFARNGMPGSVHEGVVERAIRLVGMGAVVVFSPHEYLFAVPFGAMLLAMSAVLMRAAWRKGTPRREQAPLAAALFLLVAYFTVTSTARDVSAAPRLAPFLLLTLILALAGHAWRPKARRVIVAAAAIVVLGLNALRWPTYAQINRDLAEYLSVASHLEANRTLLPLHLHGPFDAEHAGPKVSWRTDPFLHASAYLARRKVLTLNSMLLSPNVYGYFPVTYRAELDPYRFIGRNFETNPATARFADYDVRTGGKVDYVMLWDMQASPDADLVTQLEEPAFRPLFQQLQASYELVYVSPEHGWARLYRRKKG